VRVPDYRGAPHYRIVDEDPWEYRIVCDVCLRPADRDVCLDCLAQPTEGEHYELMREIETMRRVMEL